MVADLADDFYRWREALERLVDDELAEMKALADVDLETVDDEDDALDRATDALDRVSEQADVVREILRKLGEEFFERYLGEIRASTRRAG